MLNSSRNSLNFIASMFAMQGYELRPGIGENVCVRHEKPSSLTKIVLDNYVTSWYNSNIFRREEIIAQPSIDVKRKEQNWLNSLPTNNNVTEWRRT